MTASFYHNHAHQNHKIKVIPPIKKQLISFKIAKLLV
jgi:hypothetical protein